MPAAGVDGQFGPSSGGGTSSGSSYTPKPVASLLGLAGGGAPSGHYGPTPGSTTFVEEKIGVPNGVVGFIIGRGGESILSMQRRSGCKVQIQKEFEMAPGSTQRVITLTADTKDSVDMARGIIEGMVKEKMLEQQQKNASSGGVGGPGLGAAGGGAGVDPQTARMNQAIAEGHAVVKVEVSSVLNKTSSGGTSPVPLAGIYSCSNFIHRLPQSLCRFPTPTSVSSLEGEARRSK